MKKETVTRKEVAKSTEAKKIRLNMCIYFLIYLVLLVGSICEMMFYSATWGLVFAVIFSIIAAYLIIYQCIRFIRLVGGAEKMPCYVVKLDKVNYYMSGKIPVFAAAIPTENGTEIIETNVIYKKKDIDKLMNHRAKVIYDAKKKRISVITLVD